MQAKEAEKLLNVGKYKLLDDSQVHETMTIGYQDLNSQHQQESDNESDGHANIMLDM